METNQVLDGFKAQHAEIERALSACGAVASDPPVLCAKLREYRPLVLSHLDEKDRFYAALVALCVSHGDLSGKTIAEIFGQNMKVQSGAIRTFFDSLERTSPPTIAQSFATMATVLRARVTTEEKAVFPLYVKHCRQETP